MWKNEDAHDIIKDKACVLNEEGKVIFGAYDGKIRCISSSKGQVCWQLSLGSPVIAPIITCECENDQKYVYCASLSGKFYKINASVGRIEWTLLLNSPVFSLFVQCQKALYVASVKGVLYKVNYSNGQILWRKDNLGHIFAPLNILNETDLVLSTKEGFVNCLSIDSGMMRWQVQAGLAINAKVTKVKGDTLRWM